jgi:hypothetical protein
MKGLNASTLLLLLLIPVIPSSAYAQFGGFRIPGLGGGGGGTGAITEQAKVMAVNQIFNDIGKNALNGGKLVLSKKQWACKRLSEADVILAAINQAQLSAEAAKLRTQLFCDITESIPPEFLAPEDPQLPDVDTQEI